MVELSHEVAQFVNARVTYESCELVLAIFEHMFELGDMVNLSCSRITQGAAASAQTLVRPDENIAAPFITQNKEFSAWLSFAATRLKVER